MMKHLSDDELNEHLDGHDAQLDARVRAHVATCVTCAGRLESLDIVVSQLADAPRDAEPARDLWNGTGGIASRLTADGSAAGASPAHTPARVDDRAGVSPMFVGARSWPRLWVATRWGQLAAAAVIFIAGLVAGRQLSPRTESPDRPPEIAAGTDSLEIAADVQAAGTRYAAAIARLAEVRQGSAFDQGWEAAIASLYAASRTLAELSPTDADALAILHTVSRSHVNRLLETSPRVQTSIRF